MKHLVCVCVCFSTWQMHTILLGEEVSWTLFVIWDSEALWHSSSPTSWETAHSEPESANNSQANICRKRVSLEEAFYRVHCFLLLSTISQTTYPEMCQAPCMSTTLLYIMMQNDHTWRRPKKSYYDATIGYRWHNDANNGTYNIRNICFFCFPPRKTYWTCRNSHYGRFPLFSSLNNARDMELIWNITNYIFFPHTVAYPLATFRIYIFSFDGIDVLLTTVNITIWSIYLCTI